jgi:transposase-like protein
MDADPALTKLRRVTGRRDRAASDWRQAILDAHAAGCSLRAIAAAAGVSHVRVIQILRGE